MDDARRWELEFKLADRDHRNYVRGWRDALALGIPDTPRGRAEAFLRDALSRGPAPATEIVQRAAGAGISKRTLDRAKRDIGVVSVRQGAAWVWELKIAKVANSGGLDAKAA